MSVTQTQSQKSYLEPLLWVFPGELNYHIILLRAEITQPIGGILVI